MLDGNPRLNLASFVTTWMEPECDKLISEALNKNYIDMDEYPVTTEIQVRAKLTARTRQILQLFAELRALDLQMISVKPDLSNQKRSRRSYLVLTGFSPSQDRCVNMIARLFHAPVADGDQAIGVSTVGSSEAIMLAGLAFKRKWQNKRKAEGKPYDKPNMVVGANVQVRYNSLQSSFCGTACCPTSRD